MSMQIGLRTYDLRYVGSDDGGLHYDTWLMTLIALIMPEDL
jgi:hypothetical protein